jgi:hypothetical protein
MSGPLWHCVRKNRGWITYCGRSLERLVTARKREFAYHQDRDTFLKEPGRKCATCTAAARGEKQREGAAAAAAHVHNEKSLSALRTFRRAAANAGF